MSDRGCSCGLDIINQRTLGSYSLSERARVDLCCRAREFALPFLVDFFFVKRKRLSNGDIHQSQGHAFVEDFDCRKNVKNALNIAIVNARRLPEPNVHFNVPDTICPRRANSRKLEVPRSQWHQTKPYAPHIRTNNSGTNKPVNYFPIRTPAEYAWSLMTSALLCGYAVWELHMLLQSQKKRCWPYHANEYTNQIKYFKSLGCVSGDPIQTEVSVVDILK